MRHGAVDATELTQGANRTRGARASFGGEDIDFIGRADFIRNKRQTGRLKDLADIEGLD